MEEELSQSILARPRKTSASADKGGTHDLQDEIEAEVNAVNDEQVVEGTIEPEKEKNPSTEKTYVTKQLLFSSTPPPSK